MNDEYPIVELHEVCSKISVGLAIALTPFMSDFGVKLIRNQNIRPNRFDSSSFVFLTKEFAIKHRSKIIFQNDVIVVRTGANIGDACVVPPKFDGAQSFTTLIARPKSGRLDSRYLSQFINSQLGRSEVMRLMAGGGKGNLNSSQLEKLRIVLPPIESQQVIANLLSTWDTAIEKIERLIAAKEKRFSCLRDRLINQEIKKGKWQQVKLIEVFSERVEPKFNDLPLLSITREEGVILRQDVNRKDTSNNDKSKYLRICPGDIGYNTMRMWQGVSALSTLEGIVSPAYTICIPSDRLYGEFVALYFKTPLLINKFYRFSQGLTSDTWNLKFKHFKEIKVAIPALDQQKRIATTLSTARREVDLLKKQLEAFRNQKRGLMQKLLTGEWRVIVKEKQNTCLEN